MNIFSSNYITNLESLFGFPDVPALVHTRTFELWAEDRMNPEIEAKKDWTRKTFQIQPRSHKMILLKKTL